MSNDSVVWSGRPSYLYRLSHFIMSGLLLVLALCVLIASDSDGKGVLAALIGIPGLLIVAHIALWRFSTEYIVTEKSALCKTGILSRDTNEIQLKDIRNLKMKQGIIERLLCLGSIHFATAGTDDMELSFCGIENADKVLSKIKSLRE